MFDNRNALPAPAPIPRYQGQYYGNRYPNGAEQQALHNQHYGYQIQDGEMRKHHSPQGYKGAPPQSGKQGEPIITGPSGTGKRDPGQDG